uniref:peptidyl-prolyl cis-trans isomerase FKBP11-like isoform X3 n=1 Tax=Myxine glutinosa TaxID=7769 RepID=UPI0035901C1A
MCAMVVHCSLRVWPRVALSVFAIVLSLAPGEDARRAQRQRVRISLQVETLFKPPTCWQKAWIGDVVHVRHTVSEWIIRKELQKRRERRRLIIPPHLAYGRHGLRPTIPGGAMIEYEVELLTLEKASFLTRIFPSTGKLFLFLVLSVIFITGLVCFLARPWQRSKGSQEGARSIRHSYFKRKKR